MTKLIALLLSLVCGLAQAQVAQLGAFSPNTNTITLTGNTSGSIPTPVQAVGAPGGSNAQYLLTNTGNNFAFLSYSNSSAGATTNCVIPTGTTQPVIPLLPVSQIVITLPPNMFWCAITSSGTAVIYITEGVGN